MKARPIIFSGEMIRALLAGQKTQTRRVVKHRHAYETSIEKMTKQAISDRLNAPARILDSEVTEAIKYLINNSPYGQPGDFLYVKETWCPVNDRDYGGDLWIDYRATPKYEASHPAGWENAPNDAEALKWKSSRYMPRKYSRLTLEITHIRIERVQDISEQDALAEGVMYWLDSVSHEQQAKIYNCGIGPIAVYQMLFEKINGIYLWIQNPWVWVIEFEVIKKNIDEVTQP